MLTLNKSICLPEEMILVEGIRPSSMTTDMFFTIDEDSEGEFYGVRDDFGIEDVPRRIWNIEEPIDKDHDYREFGPNHNLSATINWKEIPKEHRKLSKTHFEMDDLRNVYKNLKGKDLEWLKKNNDTLKKIYDKHADDAGVDSNQECCEFNPEVHENNSLTEESIACEEKTHKSKEYLEFWDYMVGLINKCPDHAYLLAKRYMKIDIIGNIHTISSYNEDIMTVNDIIWVVHVTKGGQRNNGMMRYAQFRMMEARKCTVNQLDYNGFIIEFKGVDLHTFAHMFKFNYNETKERRINCITHGCANRIKPPKLSGVTMQVEPSERFEKFVILSFYFNGVKVKLMKGKTATNWLNPNKLNHDDMNEAIAWARAELTKK